MRIKVKGHSPQEYLDVIEILRKHEISTFACSSKRLFVSIPEPRPDVRDEIVKTGADVTEDIKQWSDMEV